MYKWVGYDECRKCGFQTEDDDEIALHCLECDSTYTTKKKQVQTGTQSVQVGTEKVQVGTNKVQTGTEKVKVKWMLTLLMTTSVTSAQAVVLRNKYISA